MEIPKNLKDQIWEYCRLNDITDLNAFMVKSLQQGFNIEKYGPTPFNNKESEVLEKIVEVIKEVPVEVIKEVEKIVEVIKEVPVEKVIEIEKEIIKEVYISNDEELLETFEKERNDYLRIQNEKDLEINNLKVKISDLNDKILQPQNNDKLIKNLNQQIENLKIELELEKNRGIIIQKRESTEEKPIKNALNNIINWVSKSEREDKDIYNE
jgi:hypothetical protein